MGLKGFIEGLGYTDVTEQKDRGYFLSCYNRPVVRCSSMRSHRPIAAS
jgi:hypothetical protein